ncbi:MULTISPECIES: hypothetical protein [Lysinibacillus]|uniref:hypothetical protein n=1 Tax=Lysinibacillus TaxID=400634 RepID=UPI000C187EB7|nr:hypothetical protein [Lysinibacillus sphaericus]PIJ95812.1 hypothetical protein CTN02_21870 [Lysinibacillus sphaericus]
MITKLTSGTFTVQGKLMVAKEKVKAFFTEEKSANQYSDNGYLGYIGLIAGIIALAIISSSTDWSFNDIGNFFVDGVNGVHDESGLNQWSDKTDGFNRK